MFGHQFVVWSFGLASDLQVYYTLMPSALLLLVGVQHWRWFLLFFTLCLSALMFTLFFVPSEGLLIPEDDKFRDLLSSQAMVNAIAINAAISFMRSPPSSAPRSSSQISTSARRLLIETVMPQPIAERLKSGEEHIADRIEMLSVMFTDLVGFTKCGARPRSRGGGRVSR